MDEAELPIDPALMVKPRTASQLAQGLSRERRACWRCPQAQQPTAIFAISDKTALGAMEALKDAGLRVPDDMALVGFDDVSESGQVTPSLTTVRLPAHAMGEAAVQRLVDLVEGAGTSPSKTVLYTELDHPPVIRRGPSRRVSAALARKGRSMAAPS